MKTESTDSKQIETSDTGAPTLHRRENSPEIRADGPVGQGGDASATIHDRTGLYISIIALFVATLALGMVLMLPAQQAARVEVATDAARKAEREARVMQERWNDLKVELAKRGIPVSDH